MGARTLGGNVRPEMVQQLMGVALKAMKTVDQTVTIPEIASASFSLTSALISAVLDNSDGTERELNRMAIVDAINQLFVKAQPPTSKLN